MIQRSEIEKIIRAASPHPLKKIRFLTHGMNSTTFSASTRSDQFILTVFHGKDKYIDLPLLMRSNALLGQTGFPVPAILAHGHILNQEILLTTYHHGKVKNIFEKDDYQKIGFLVGNMHVAMQSFDSPTVRTSLVSTLRSDYEMIAKELPKDFSLIDKHLSYLESVWPAHLPKGVIHGDLWQKNILFEGDEISAVLDFTSAMYDLLLFDLAGLFKSIYFSNNSEEHFDALLSKYQMARPLLEEELAHVGTCIIAKMLMTILYMCKKSFTHPEQKAELFSIAIMNLMKLEHSDVQNLELVHALQHA